MSEHYVTSRADGYGNRDCSCGGVWNDGDKTCSTLKATHQPVELFERLQKSIDDRPAFLKTAINSSTYGVTDCCQPDEGIKQESLKPCPFCGNQARIDSLGVFAVCDHCGTTGPDADAAYTWNDRALERTEESYSWQPIETAPKDQSTLLLFSSSWESTFSGRWEDTRWICDWSSIKLDDITHWMPLPIAPTTQIEGDVK